MLPDRAALFLGASALAVGVGLVVHTAEIDFDSFSLGRVVGAAIVLVGLLLAASMALPPGTRLVPGSLMGLGAAIYLAASGQVSTQDDWLIVSGLVLATAGFVLLLKVRVERTPSADPVQTFRVAFLSRQLRLAKQRLPSHQRVNVYGTAAQIDMRGAASSTEDILELSVTAIFGRVDVTIPDHWLVLPGRLNVNSRSRLDVSFDHTEPIPYLGPEERNDIQGLAASHSETTPSRHSPYPVVLNVTSVNSHIHVTRAKR